jgi:diguanylate cyclase (GGDEF)-like protein
MFNVQLIRVAPSLAKYISGAPLNHVLKVASDPELNVLTRRAASRLHVPMAALVLLDAERKWTQSTVGLPKNSPIPHDLAFCSPPILAPVGVTFVQDTQLDDRFTTTPAVNGRTAIRFYAGAPLIDTAGVRLGALCIFDTKPRLVNDDDLETLILFAEIVSARLEFCRISFALRQCEEHYRNSVELNHQRPWTADAQGRIEKAAPGSLPVTAKTHGNMSSPGWAKTLHRDDAAHALTSWTESIRTGTPFDVEYRQWLAGGQCRWFRSRAVPRRSVAGTIIRWYGTLEDIHDRKSAELEQREGARRLSFALQVGGLGAWEVDTQTHRVVCSELCLRNFGLTRADQLSSYDLLLAVIHPDDRDRCGLEVQKALETGLEMNIEFRNVWPDGTLHWIRVTGRAQFGKNGVALRVVGLSLDVTDKRRADDERTRSEVALLHLANHDPLTNLANRRCLELALAAALATASPENRHALFCIDLDQFKTVNDQLGHDAGDRLLQHAARRLRSCVRQHDTVARHGGDEFAVLQTGIREAGDIELLAHRLLAALAEPFDLDGRTVVLGCSIGISVAPNDAGDGGQLYRNADAALYRAKTSGRGSHCFYDAEKDTRVQLDDALRLALPSALANNELSLHYQPLIDLKTGEIETMEALMRWEHPVRGTISPGDFIPIAEEAGWIGRFGLWALEEACRQAMSWPLPVAVAVNLSPIQFLVGDLERDVAQALACSGLPPSRLELEITETVLLQASPATTALLEALQRRGVRIVMDDFGTGYSSLGYLRKFKFDKIKIDRSLIAGLPDGGGGDAILIAVAGLGRSLGIEVTAEGVETSEQHGFVAKYGCSQAQGYLFSVPVAASAVPELLRKQFFVGELDLAAA